MMEKPKVLIVDDDEDLRHALRQGIELADYEVEDFSNGASALIHIQRELLGVLVTDIRMPEMDGLELMSKTLEIDPAMPVILITGHGDVSLAVEAMRTGAYDFIEKPFATEQLISAISRALEKRRLVLENRLLRKELSGQAGLDKRLVGRTPAMLKLRSEVMALANTDIDVLIWGETGSGKEVVARALHEEGSRKDKPFVAINCGAIPAEMMESELFGHEPGAFTSANKKRIGKLEFANGGTVFLDEIESMPLELQVKILRVLEERSIQRLGSNEMIALDVRFIAATKTDLASASQNDEFRSDLYFRLNVVTLNIPPLRERKEDIPILVHHLAREARARYRRDIPDIDSSMITELNKYDWPGNVRELRNVLDRWILGLGINLPGQTAPESSQQTTELCKQMSEFEKNIILSCLMGNEGRIKDTYEQLGISRKSLYEKMRKYQIDASEFKGNS